MKDMRIVTAIANHAALTQICGTWPSFRGAEMSAFRLASKDRNASVEIDVRLAEVSRGCDVTLRFDYVDDIEVEDWGHQNVLRNLLIEYDDDEKRFEVELPGSKGVSAEFRCLRISVISAHART